MILWVTIRDTQSLGEVLLYYLKQKPTILCQMALTFTQRVSEFMCEVSLPTHPQISPGLQLYDVNVWDILVIISICITVASLFCINNQQILKGERLGAGHFKLLWWKYQIGPLLWTAQSRERSTWNKIKQEFSDELNCIPYHASGEVLSNS